MSLTEKYRTACEAFEVEPRSEVESALIDGEETGDLDLSRGNSSAHAGETKLDNEDVLPVLDALCDNDSVVSVSLSYNKVADMGAKGVASVLKHNASISCLELAYNDLTPSGAKLLAEALEHNKSLLRLNIDGNSVGKAGLDFANAIKVNTTLEELSLGNCELDTSSLIAIFNALTGPNATLRMISVCNPRTFSVQDEIASHLAHCLRVNTSLVSVSLSRLDLGGDGVARIAEELSLTPNKTLEVLDISACRIPPTGGVHIAKIIENCTALRWLNIGRNRLEKEGIIPIAQVLRDTAADSADEGRILESINLSNNNIDDHGLTIISDALHVNQTVKRVWVWGNDFGDVASSAWADLLESRSSGVELKADVLATIVDGKPQIGLLNE